MVLLCLQDILVGAAKFVDNHTIKYGLPGRVDVGGQVTAKDVIIATGSVPFVPPGGQWAGKHQQQQQQHRARPERQSLEASSVAAVSLRAKEPRVEMTFARLGARSRGWLSPKNKVLPGTWLRWPVEAVGVSCCTYINRGGRQLLT